MPLAGRHVAVTGGSGGVGRPLVEGLLADGALVTVLGRTALPDRPRLSCIAADFCTDRGLQEATAILAGIGPDVLVHLAGQQYFGPFDSQALDDIIRAYHINLVAPAILTRAVLPAMKFKGRGQVIFAGSVFGAIPFAHFAAYSSAKAGLAALSLALERENRGSGIAFTCVVPRAIRTGMATEKIRQFAKLAKFKFDEPVSVANRLRHIIRKGGGRLGPGFPEALFMRIHGLSPSLVSMGVHGTNAKARALFSSKSAAVRE
ncbi:MAG: SDR family NAD(P)-dependent oxidoreductase [Hyphomicrobiales bacterium]